jgi:hypothetical protein
MDGDKKGKIFHQSSSQQPLIYSSHHSSSSSCLCSVHVEQVRQQQANYET